MRILLAHNSLYFPSHGGGDKSNRLLMEALCERGHTVRVVTRVERFGAADHARLLADLHARGVEAETTEQGIVRFDRNGVDIHTVALQPNIRPYFSKQIAEFDPDVIITSTDDPGQLLFDLAIRAPRARVVHLVRATIAVPFGPDSSAPNPAKADLLKRADGVVGVSNYVAGYVRRWGGIGAIHLPISLLEATPEYPYLGRFENRFVTLANPCAVKGISIFLELADRMPHVEFAAVPTWGTTPEDVVELERRPNIAIMAPVDDINDLLRMTRVLLVPSVWAEARSRIVVEAMSRGVPVISSNAGGLPEAHLGVDYVLPVNLITRYKPSVDLNMVPVADVPPQDVDPWQVALERLHSDRVHWEEISRRSRDAALDYARNLNVLPFESYLEEVLTRPKKGPAATALSDEKRKLLALRLKHKAAPPPKPDSDPWFAGLEEIEPGKLVLFCFSYAGAGTLTYRRWADALREVATLVAIRLPGRESRIGERPFESMGQLVPVLGSAIEPQLSGRRFAFFGHSMGAGIAFELTRWLRRQAKPLPERLIVSSARAPQYRRGLQPAPDPDDAHLMEQLRQMQGVPADIDSKPDILRLLMPVLRADTKLYRNYVFQEEEPLDIDIKAYAGADDPNLPPDLMQPWRELTTGSFELRVFPGGHFYFNQVQSELLQALVQDLRQA